ncbi:MAG: UDP-N-acetylmuramoyl-L-alanine--D-glutamate ligase [Holosporaceae bacterium]|jgi:UDP-N-acetylmuramoylalanine--D-glutamate ligase|nr:UDP-N-acetylmuramoyl-L-alanine--D-glutamate ligase [Holosporaceae bacterium]
MILLDFYRNKRVGVVGLGKTGKSVIDSLTASGATVISYDDSQISSGKYRNLSLADFNSEQLDAIIVSPGINLLWPSVHPVIKAAKQKSIPILNDIDLFQQHVIAKVNICITGTNGKSTTAALVNHLLSFTGKKVSIGCNFGNPILSLDFDSDFFVLELSSYQLESCNILGFDTSILLNITPDHLTRHGGIEGYVASKQKIFANFHEKSNAIVGVDCSSCIKIFEFLKKLNHPNVIPISGKVVPEFGVGWDKNKLVDNRDGLYRVICGNKATLDGDHNRQNIAASYAACIQNGLSEESFCEGLFLFKGLEHRQEIVIDIDGLPYVNDSKATNADSTEEALKRFNNIIWILGGRPKENGIESLIQYFDKIRFALLIGEIAEEWSILLTKYGVKNEIAKTLNVAVKRSKEISKIYGAEVVLLSPACASFDQFNGFEDRGNQFKRLVSEEKTK